jgi:hypothetical protein
MSLATRMLRLLGQAQQVEISVIRSPLAQSREP